ncbi:MAG TPA: SBBP repeat-containing protein [Bryobacteraceae bacterium]|nr:SBBP repeat-containing protein [Bryobacteraceae bacterium]
MLVLILLFSYGALAADFTTYIGDAFPYRPAAIAADAAGNTYVAGSRQVTASLSDVFVTKLDASGNLVFTRTFSGKGSDQARGIALDSAGNILVVGSTSSPDFPLKDPTLQATPGVGTTGFLLKLANDGSTIFSTYFGGTLNASSLNAVAVDSKGDIYVAGRTNSSDYPRTAGLPAGVVRPQMGLSAVSAAFFAKISAAGDKILYAGAVSATEPACGAGSSCFLSAITTSGDSIAVDAAGNAYIGGNTNGGGLKGTFGALLPEGIGAFVLKINASGTSVGYLTYLGSANAIIGPFANPGSAVSAIAVNASGRLYLTGSTYDPGFLNVTPGTLFCPASSGTNRRGLYLATVDPTGSVAALLQKSCGDANRTGTAVAIDIRGTVAAAGTADSDSVNRVLDLLLETFVPGNDAIEPGADQRPALLLERPFNFLSAALAFDASGMLHTAGGTGLISSFTPTQILSQRVYGVANSAGGLLAGRISPGELFSIYGLKFGVAAQAATFDSVGLLPKVFGGVQVTVNDFPAPLLYVSDTQINAIVPLAIQAGVARIQITINGTRLPDFRAYVDATAPQVFRNLDATAAALNQDGSINSPANPARVGTLVSIFATGAGTIQGVDGQRTAAALPGPFPAVLNGDHFLTITYSGAAPGLVTGVTQINFRLPIPGSSPIFNPVFTLSAGGRNSEAFTIFVQ